MDHELPQYSEIRDVPSGRIPSDLSNLEMGDEFGIQRAHVEKWLGEPPRVPTIEDPLFTELITLNEDGFLTITLPKSDDRVLPLFSTPYRAADY